jgi:N-acetylglucosaminyl-diphospho-decaprenol L-rhamnosyltransferase
MTGPALSVSKFNDSPEDSARTAEVTAVVVTHNSARHLASLGHALTSGSLVPSRMLVVDNDSADDTDVQARAAGFEIHEARSNRGFGAACNIGLSIASTEFVLFCNPDTVPAFGTLETLTNELKSSPKAAIVGAALSNPIQARQFSRITATIAGFLPNRIQPYVRHLKTSQHVDQGKDPIVVDYAEGAFILCRASALRSVGGFDEHFFLYCEEEDLARRLNEHGWQTLLATSAIVEHEHSASSEGVGSDTMAPFRIHSLYWYYRKYHSRLYAEFARFAISGCVAIDQGYRALARRPQVYGPGTAMAPFRSTAMVRRCHERLAGK